MSPWIILDTSVLVSGLITRNAEAPTAVLVDMAVEGRIGLVLSSALVDEYRRVLRRDGLRRLHRRSDTEIDVLIADLRLGAVWSEPPGAPEPCPDPDDAHLWALLFAHADAILVTGEAALVGSPPEGRRVLRPADAVAVLRSD